MVMFNEISKENTKYSLLPRRSIEGRSGKSLSVTRMVPEHVWHRCPTDGREMSAAQGTCYRRTSTQHAKERPTIYKKTRDNKIPQHLMF